MFTKWRDELLIVIMCVVGSVLLAARLGPARVYVLQLLQVVVVIIGAVLVAVNLLLGKTARRTGVFDTERPESPPTGEQRSRASDLLNPLLGLLVALWVVSLFLTPLYADAFRLALYASMMVVAARSVWFIIKLWEQYDDSTRQAIELARELINDTANDAHPEPSLWQAAFLLAREVGQVMLNQADADRAHYTRLLAEIEAAKQEAAMVLTTKAGRRGLKANDWLFEQAKDDKTIGEVLAEYKERYEQETGESICLEEAREKAENALNYRRRKSRQR